MFALRWASIQCSSQFSYLTRNDFIVSLFTVSTIGNRENLPETFAEFCSSKHKKMKQGRSLGGDGYNYVNPSLDIISFFKQLR